MLDINATDTWWIVSDEKMMLNRQDYTPGDDGKWDSIERTWHAYYTYDSDIFLDAIKSCWKKIYRKNTITKFLFGKYYIQGERYPGHTNTFMSRDHLIYTLAAFKHSGMSEKDLYEFTSHIRFMISNRIGMQMTPSLWLWMKLISGKKIGYLFYIFIFFEILFNIIWNNSISFFTGLNKEQSQDEFHMLSRSDRPIALTIPSSLIFLPYGTKLIATQLSILKNDIFNKFLKKFTLKLVSKYNFLQRLLLDDTENITEENINSYIPMSGDRWSGILDPWVNDRQLFFIHDKYLRANVLDKDYLIKVYQNKSTK